MIEVRVDFSDLEALTARLKRAIPKAVEAMAQTIHDDADKRVPEDTGKLRKSGRIETRLVPRAGRNGSRRGLRR